MTNLSTSTEKYPRTIQVIGCIYLYIILMKINGFCDVCFIVNCSKCGARGMPQRSIKWRLYGFKNSITPVVYLRYKALCLMTRDKKLFSVLIAY